jgi:hypothetical protein
MTLRNQAERAIASVVESERPLCKVELRVHGGQACSAREPRLPFK